MSLNPTYPAAAVPYLMIRGAADALESLVVEGLERTQSTFNS